MILQLSDPVSATCGFTTFFSIVLLTEVVNAYPSFLNVFGIRAKDGSLNIPPSWQNGIVAATNCGEVIGLQVSRTFATRAPSS